MLRFAQPPDAVFLAIVHDALEDLQETLTDLEAEDWLLPITTKRTFLNREPART